MCLITVAYGVSARFPIAVAANRDERHARASAPAAWWSDAPDVLAGRDLVAGGTWLGIERGGRIGAVTNRAPASSAAAPPRSRGALVAEYLRASASAEAYGARALVDAQSYGAFNLVLVDRSGVSTVSGCGETVRLDRGTRSFGNAALDADWPKLAAASAGVERALETSDPLSALFEVLATRGARSPPSGPDRENLFVLGAEFGTRCSTVILVDAAGRVMFAERRFDAGAAPAGESRFTFTLRAAT